ncbi:hypothetical protein PHYBOEH_001710 [Phytophthora boehmeriae]|uniref:Uncharacterized protein n=1 Tax=Phytophthora boehmeriae TaxID=109152 RepID=A0A8T1WRV2_9STRA|nr:hypothetical protein PHYBOEH_001710 [Phytophthora boehmeriae]
MFRPRLHAFILLFGVSLVEVSAVEWNAAVPSVPGFVALLLSDVNMLRNCVVWTGVSTGASIPLLLLGVIPYQWLCVQGKTKTSKLVAARYGHDICVPNPRIQCALKLGKNHPMERGFSVSILTIRAHADRMEFLWIALLRLWYCAAIVLTLIFSNTPLGYCIAAGCCLLVVVGELWWMHPIQCRSHQQTDHARPTSHDNTNPKNLSDPLLPPTSTAVTIDSDGLGGRSSRVLPPFDIYVDPEPQQQVVQLVRICECGQHSVDHWLHPRRPDWRSWYQVAVLGSSVFLSALTYVQLSQFGQLVACSMGIFDVVVLGASVLIFKPSVRREIVTKSNLATLFAWLYQHYGIKPSRLPPHTLTLCEGEERWVLETTKRLMADEGYTGDTRAILANEISTKANFDGVATSPQNWRDSRTDSDVQQFGELGRGEEL